MTALAIRAPTFIGKPCAKCGETLRFVNDNQRCVACKRANYLRNNQHRHRLIILSPEEKKRRARDAAKRFRQSEAGQEWMRQYRENYIKTPEGRAKIRAQREKERGAIRRERSLKYIYGITVEQYEAMVVAQNNKCAICNRDGSQNWGGKLHVDHCHNTGRVRGLLCIHCNHAIGKLNDDPDLIIKAADYVRGGGYR